MITFGKRIYLPNVLSALFATIIGVSLAVSLSACGGSGATAPASTAQDESSQAEEDEEAAKRTAEEEELTKKLEKQIASEDSAAEQEAEEQDATKTENTEEDAHAALRAEAEANGEQVFEGTLHICYGDEASNLLGTQAALSANGAQAEEGTRKTEYALLEFDAPQDVYVTGYSGGPFIQQYSYVNLGEYRYNIYSGAYDGEDGVAAWRDYNGQRVCAAVANFGISEGVSIISVPSAITSRFLYVK